MCAMAGPQFLTPQPVFSSRPRRRFTLAQANRALPLVRRVVDGPNRRGWDDPELDVYEQYRKKP